MDGGIIIFMQGIKWLVVLLLMGQGLTKLYQVVSMFRHGARYHLNDVYDGNSTKAQWGELTAVGLRQHQNLGRAWRKEYIEQLPFLSPTYNLTEIEAYSTPFNRTISSALSLLSGLYPLGTGPKMPVVDNIFHLPPYSNKSDVFEQNYALPQGQQNIFIRYDSSVLFGDCFNANAEMTKNIEKQSVVCKEMNLTYQPFMRKMADIFKLNASKTNFVGMQQLYDTLTVDQYLGRPLPSTFTEADYINLRHLHNWYNAIKFSNNLSRAINAPKFNEILTVFANRVRLPDKYSLKWTFLSAHDTDLISAMVDLNISSATCIEDLYRNNFTSEINCEPGPEYAASLIFELHSDDGKNFYVKIKSNGHYINLCATKSPSCSYFDWSSRIKKLLTPDYSDICRPYQSSQTLFNKKKLESSLIQ